MGENMYRPCGKEYLHVNDDRALKIDQKYISYLKLLAQQNNEGKCTMCLHNDTRAHVHEMVNVYPGNSYIRPHSHPFKTETKIIIDGKLMMVIFDETGEIIDTFVLEKDGVFTFRLDKGIIHTNIPLVDSVFSEIITGPFVGKDDSVFPDWAPTPDDEEGVRIIMDRMKQRLGAEV